MTTSLKSITKIQVKIDHDRCKGCEYCIEFCPKKVLGLSKGVNKRGLYYAVMVNPENCTGCAICARVCPDMAIEVYT